jgi:hypothetical protein
MVTRQIIRSLSGLGIVPNDFELAKTFTSYTPVHAGWISQKGGPAIPALGDAGLGLELFEGQEKLLRRQLVIQGVTAGSLAVLAAVAVTSLLKGKKPSFSY